MKILYLAVLTSLLTFQSSASSAQIRFSIEYVIDEITNVPRGVLSFKRESDNEEWKDAGPDSWNAFSYEEKCKLHSDLKNRFGKNYWGNKFNCDEFLAVINNQISENNYIFIEDLDLTYMVGHLAAIKHYLAEFSEKKKSEACFLNEAKPFRTLPPLLIEHFAKIESIEANFCPLRFLRSKEFKEGYDAGKKINPDRSSWREYISYLLNRGAILSEKIISSITGDLHAQGARRERRRSPASIPESNNDDLYEINRRTLNNRATQILQLREICKGRPPACMREGLSRLRDDKSSCSDQLRTRADNLEREIGQRYAGDEEKNREVRERIKQQLERAIADNKEFEEKIDSFFNGNPEELDHYVEKKILEIVLDNIDAYRDAMDDPDAPINLLIVDPVTGEMVGEEEVRAGEFYGVDPSDGVKEDETGSPYPDDLEPPSDSNPFKDPQEETPREKEADDSRARDDPLAVKENPRKEERPTSPPAGHKDKPNELKAIDIAVDIVRRADEVGIKISMKDALRMAREAILRGLTNIDGGMLIGIGRSHDEVDNPEDKLRKEELREKVLSHALIHGGSYFSRHSGRILKELANSARMQDFLAKKIRDKKNKNELSSFRQKNREFGQKRNSDKDMFKEAQDGDLTDKRGERRSLDQNRQRRRAPMADPRRLSSIFPQSSARSNQSKNYNNQLPPANTRPERSLRDKNKNRLQPASAEDLKNSIEEDQKNLADTERFSREGISSPRDLVNEDFRGRFPASHSFKDTEKSIPISLEQERLEDILRGLVDAGKARLLSKREGENLDFLLNIYYLGESLAGESIFNSAILDLEKSVARALIAKILLPKIKNKNHIDSIDHRMTIILRVSLASELFLRYTHREGYIFNREDLEVIPKRSQGGLFKVFSVF